MVKCEPIRGVSPFSILVVLPMGLKSGLVGFGLGGGLSAGLLSSFLSAILTSGSVTKTLNQFVDNLRFYVDHRARLV